MTTTPSKFAYSFNDWDSGYDTDLPQDILDKLPPPFKYRNYNPTWGKGSKSAEKAVHTMNHKIFQQNVELFAREVLPVIENIVDNESLFSIGITTKNARLIEKSGMRYWTTGNRGSWIATGDPSESKASKLGAKPVSAEAYFEMMK